MNVMRTAATQILGEVTAVNPQCRVPSLHDETYDQYRGPELLAHFKHMARSLHNKHRKTFSFFSSGAKFYCI